MGIGLPHPVEAGRSQKVRIRVGTSGYSYSWNKGKPTPFEWYLGQGFDTVEVNASFYRFPSRSWAKAWNRSPEDFTFCIKVHRSITHYARLRGRAIHLWQRFNEPLKEVEHKIAFWLFQMPPSFAPTERNLEAINHFFRDLDLGNSAVLEFRQGDWWKRVDVCREVGAAFCSVDAPELPRDIISMNDVVYVRLHGREQWYSYVYSEEELEQIVAKVKALKAREKYILLNNDSGMLPNGKYLLKLLKDT